MKKRMCFWVLLLVAAAAVCAVMAGCENPFAGWPEFAFDGEVWRLAE